MLKPEDRVVVYARPGCHVCGRVKKYLGEHGIAFEMRDVDAEPLTPRELWDLFNRKANRLRVPFTALNDGEDVVLGFDPQRLEGVFVHGELGGVQPSTAPAAASTYDGFAGPDLDADLWKPAPGAAEVALIPTGYDVRAGAGSLQVTGTGSGRASSDPQPGPEFHSVSTERFGTPPGSDTAFEIRMAFDPDRPATGTGPLAGPMAAVALRDLPTGMLLGFEVHGDLVFAVHQRSGPEGVASAQERFSHRVLVDLTSAPTQQHSYRITYSHNSAQADWYVDDECVYTAVVPFQFEGVSLALRMRATGETDGRRPRVTWTPWGIQPA